MVLPRLQLLQGCAAPPRAAGESLPWCLGHLHPPFFSDPGVHVLAKCFVPPPLPLWCFLPFLKYLFADRVSSALWWGCCWAGWTCVQLGAAPAAPHRGRFLNLTARFLRSTGYNGVFSGICVVLEVLRSYLIMFWYNARWNNNPCQRFVNFAWELL